MFLASFKDNPVLNTFLILMGVVGVTVFYFVARAFLDKLNESGGEEDDP